MNVLDIAQLFAPILLVAVVQAVYSVKQTTAPQTPYDHTSRYFLFIISTTCILLAFWPPYNVFNEHNVAPNDLDITLKIRQFGSDYEGLLSDTKRQNYNLYGETIYSCPWCIDSMDYAIYNLSEIALYYSIFLVFFSFWTASPRREAWRYYVCVSLLILLALEVYHIFVYVQPIFFAYESDVTMIWRIRFGFFALCSFAAAYLQTDFTEHEMIISLIQSQWAVLQ
jgi:hypothetical protein